MSKHTPGPWDICGDEGKPKTTVFKFHHNGSILQLISEEDSEANARLIAAAPEAHALLREREWVAHETASRGIVIICEYCQQFKNEGHAPDCKLAAYFKKVEGGE